MLATRQTKFVDIDRHRTLTANAAMIAICEPSWNIDASSEQIADSRQQLFVGLQLVNKSVKPSREAAKYVSAGI